jgi:hypothetical protein
VIAAAVRRRRLRRMSDTELIAALWVAERTWGKGSAEWLRVARVLRDRIDGLLSSAPPGTDPWAAS